MVTESKFLGIHIVLWRKTTQNCEKPPETSIFYDRFPYEIFTKMHVLENFEIVLGNLTLDLKSRQQSIFDKSMYLKFIGSIIWIFVEGIETKRNHKKHLFFKKRISNLFCVFRRIKNIIDEKLVLSMSYHPLNLILMSGGLLAIFKCSGTCILEIFHIEN